MSDPVVCAFLTKLLCSQGGCLDYQELPRHVELPDSQLKQVLQDAGESRFLQVPQPGGAPAAAGQVFALSPVRLCTKHECGGCERLHICKKHLRGKCFRPCRGKWACKYNHDVFSVDNRKVLKLHELSGLNENELRVLLLQNDPFLLPDVCGFYNKGDGNCTQQDNCTKLHVCRHFLKGECRFPRCKRSHSLTTPNALRLLQAEGVDDKIAWNIQTICSHKTAEIVRQLRSRKEYNSNSKPVMTSSTEKRKSYTGNQEQRSEPASCKPTLVDLGPGQSEKPAPPTKCPLNEEKKKSDEICLYYIWRFCKNRNNCPMIHYDLPYRWQIYTGSNWNDLPKMEEIEKAYCNPSVTCILEPNINFMTMTSRIFVPIRRQSTPSSVTKPAKFVMATKWIWYWNNELGEWVEYGKQGGQNQSSTLNSQDLENLYLADPTGSVQFQAGSQVYEINFKDMTQKNLHYQTQKEVRRRPMFVSSDDVNKKKSNNYKDPAPASDLTSIYPQNWDKSALPDIGFKAVELSKMSSEYDAIEKLFRNTMTNYIICKIERIQNPSLWQVFKWQKEQMKKKNGGTDVQERLLFHGTPPSTVQSICNDNFDWRICGTNGTVFGKGSYFARDAQYSHNYCVSSAKIKSMFVARVLVGDFVRGNPTYNRPPAKPTNSLTCYDSCVDNPSAPSIFIIFEKHQIYPEYIIHYEEEKKCAIA